MLCLATAKLCSVSFKIHHTLTLAARLLAVYCHQSGVAFAKTFVSQGNAVHAEIVASSI